MAQQTIRMRDRLLVALVLQCAVECAAGFDNCFRRNGNQIVQCDTAFAASVLKRREFMPARCLRRTQITHSRSDISAAAVVANAGVSIGEDFLQNEELLLLREGLKHLENKLDQAVKAEEYAVAAQVHNALKFMQQKDPELRLQQLKTELATAVKVEDYASATAVHKQIQQVYPYLPQYNLGGLWQAEHPETGNEVLVHLSYEGDSVVATQLGRGGEQMFRADITQDVQNIQTDAHGMEDMNVQVDVQCVSEEDGQSQKVSRYLGQGSIMAADQFRTGELLLIDEDVIGFLFLPAGSFLVFNRLDSKAQTQVQTEIQLGWLKEDL